jgi:serine/threonine protein phosphatase PrpC
MDRPRPMDRDDDDTLDLPPVRADLGGYGAFRPKSSAVEVEFGACTHPGLRRTTSDDHYLIVRLGRDQETIASSLPAGAVPDRFHEDAYGVVVADGMGPDGPELASRLAIATLAQLVLHYGRWNVRVNERTAWEIVQRAERFYRRVGETVTDASQQHPALAGMSTTLTAIYSGGDELFVAHVGHSRAYLYRGGLLTRLTRDQTLAQRLADTGRTAPTELAAHDLRHVLTDAIGGRAGEPDIEIQNYLLVNGDVVLLCTNGLTDLVEDDTIAGVLRSGETNTLAALCQTLVDLALERGGPDNVTAVLARYRIP